MNLISNYIGEISPLQFGEKSAGTVNKLCADDLNFADILEKQFINSENSNIANPLNFRLNNYVNSVDKANDSGITTSEMLTFFNSLFDKNSVSEINSHSGLYNFARKHAANFYSKYASNTVTNLGEFVTDALNIG